MTWTDYGVVVALAFNAINLYLIVVQLKQDRQLRMAEIAMRMVEGEYKRYELAPEGLEVTLYTPQQLFDLSLHCVREVMETGSFDADKYFDFASARLLHFKEIQNKKLKKQAKAGTHPTSSSSPPSG